MKKHFSFRQTPNVFTTVSRHCNGGRTGVGIDVNSLSPHSSKRGLGKVSTLILLFALSFGFSSQAWALDKLRVKSSFDSWNTHDINNAGDTYTYLAVPAGTFYLQAQGGDSYSMSGDVIGDRYSGTITNNTWGKPSGWNDNAMQLTISEVSDVTITRGENGWDILASGIPSPYYIRYSWNGSTTWNWSNALTSEGDGKYSCIGQYGNTSAYNYNRTTNDDGQGYQTDATVVGSPLTGDQCVFTFNSSDNSLTIRKCSYVAATSHVYFDNSSANWNDSYIQFVIGRPATTGDEYSGQYKFSSITNTKLLYVAIGANWSDVAYYAIMGTSSAYNGTKWYIPNVYNADHYSAAYTNKYDLQKDMVTLVKKDNATNKGAISLNHISGGYTDFNKTQTVKVMVKKAGASNYTEETTFANWPGSIKAKRYTLNSNGTSSANETDANLEDATFTSVITSQATLTATANAGYVCRGWGDASNSTPSGNATKTYTVSDATTSYVFFEEQTYTVNFSVHSTNHGGIEVTAAGEQIQTGANVKASVEVVFTATPDEGYHVEGWYNNSGCSTGKIDDAATNETYTINSLNAAANVYVKFAANTYSVKFNGNGSTSGSMSDQSFTYDEAAKALTTNTFAKTGYTFQGWDTDQSADEVVHTDGKSVSNLTTTNDGTVNLYAVWQEKMNNNITVASNSTDKGTVNINTATFGISTGQEITATPKAGYYLASWDIPTNAQIASGEGTNTITVKASGDEEVSGTIIANFAERWVLRGSETATDNPESGMPGWSTTDAVFTFAADATEGTKTVTLLPNRKYKFKIYDRQEQANRGQKNKDQKMTSDGEFWKLDGEYDVLFDAKGYGVYTFKVKNSSDDNTLPEVKYIEVPSYLITMGTKTFSNDAVSTGDGGTITAKTTENATDFDVITGQYVRDGGSVVFTATPAKGYSFAGFYSDAACTNQITTGVTDNIYTTTITDATFVYAKFTEKLTTVVIDWDGDGKVQVKDGSGNWTDATKGETTVQAGVYTHPSVKAVVTDENSHYFAKWTWNADADFKAEHWEEDYAETTVIGFGQGLTSGQTLTAKFLELDKIYFWNIDNDVHKWKNEVHVFFNVKWNDTYGVFPAGCDHFQMQQIQGTDYWWAYIKRYVYNEGKTWSTIAFADANMSGNEYFNNNNAVYRYDYNPVNNMYVPKSRNENLNGTGYFSEGYWMNYDGYQSGDEVGYELWTSSGAPKGAFVAVGPNEARVDCRIDEISDSKGFYITTTKANVGYGTDQLFTSTSTSHALSHYLKNYNFNVKVDAEGDYSFTLKMGEGTQMILEVGFPVGVGDYRVAWINEDNKRYSDVIKSSDAANVNTLSMYLNPSAGTLSLQKCTDITDGVPQWSEGTAINWTDFTKNQGVYQFDITINGDDGTASNVGLYTGNYYIKTDGVKGGWGNYKENIMDENTSTFSETDATTYDRYYCQWISNEGCNVKCVIANDYCNALSDTLRGDDYTEMSGTEPLLPQPANVRFSYNTYTNTLKRDYISGSTDDADRFLMLLCDNNKMYDKTNETQLSELKFTDKNNWVYQADIKAQSGCAVKLTADYNSQTQYFIGAESGEGATKTIISSTEESSTKYTMRVVYDFKTNRLVAGWVPDGTEITDNIELGGDMLITREHQKEAKQITFGVKEESSTPGSISDIHHVYGVLTLQKDIMTNANTMQIGDGGKYYENNLYWISFPFEVKISEIFGVDGYGTKWILQKYNGQRRADIGWFAETPTFWEYMSKSDTLHAYEGYVLCLDPTYFNPSDADVWDNSAEEANFYFPSASGTIGIVHADTYTQTVPDHECTITRKFTVEGHSGELCHTETDSHWNVIGVPAFQDAPASTISPTNENFKSFYEWDPKTNEYKPKITLGMKLGDDEQEVEGYIFKTMHAYMVQFAGDITWTNVSMVDVPTPVAPRRLEETANYMAEIEFHQGNKANDHTYINLAENATTDFMLNEDMMKIDNAGCPNIYSFAGNYNVAYNETSKASQTIDLGVSAPAAGNYKFHMPSNFTGTVTLIDNVEQTHTDLQVQDYELYLDKGTYNDRFQLEINLQSVVTNLDNVFGGQVDSDHAVKFIRDDKMFILRSGSIFDATGKRMK